MCKLLLAGISNFLMIGGSLASAALAADEPLSQPIYHAAPAALAKDAIVSDWPGVLGPSHNETSPETHLSAGFGPNGPPLVWEISKGEGYAGPAIVGDRLVLFHRIKDDEVIECLSALTGKRNWRYTYPTAYQDEYGYCNGPRSSPTIVGDAVFAVGAEAKLHCLDLATGKLRWQHDLRKEYKLQQEFFGVGASPLVEGNVVVVNVGAKGGPCVVGFDVGTGKVVWTAGNQWGPSYASPVPATIHGKRRVLVFAGGKSNPPTGGLLCIDPATGKVDFEFPWRGTVRESVNAASPLVIGDDVFISECYGSGGIMLHLDDAMQPHEVWTNPTFNMHFMSAILKDGYLYGVAGHGPEDAFIVCVEQKTGKEIWRKQPTWKDNLMGADGPREVELGVFRGWFTPVDRRVLCLGEYGHLLWVDLSPKGYQEISRAWLFAAGETWTPPAVSKGLCYLMQASRDPARNTGPRLLCYDLRGK